MLPGSLGVPITLPCESSVLEDVVGAGVVELPLAAPGCCGVGGVGPGAGVWAIAGAAVSAKERKQAAMGFLCMSSSWLRRCSGAHGSAEEATHKAAVQPM